jgi:hypothetical protein
MFVHAIQGMMPNKVRPYSEVCENVCSIHAFLFKVASRWNFAFFTSGGGQPSSDFTNVRAIQMEFETTVSHASCTRRASAEQYLLRHIG